VLWVQYFQRDDEQNQGGPICHYSYIERTRERQNRTKHASHCEKYRDPEKLIGSIYVYENSNGTYPDGK
jgi:hypothetical protein